MEQLHNIRRYQIDHRILFLFGFVFYLFTPYIVGVSDLFAGFPGMALYQGYFKMIPREKLSAYLVITLSWLPAFYLGHLTYRVLRKKEGGIHFFEPTAVTRTIPFIAVLLFAVLILFTYLSRSSLLGGYSSYDISARGKMSTLLVIFNFFLLYNLVTRQKLSGLLVAGTAITALLLLSTGGRLYVVQTFLVILIYKTSFARVRWKLPLILMVCLLVFLAASSVGLWRMGAGFSPERAGYSLFAEPVFTWFSSSTFLIANEIPVVNVPTNFLTSFLNLVPNTIISLKPYIISIQGMGYTAQSPLGADSVWSNFVINFGSAGSFFFLFLTGFLLNFLKSLSKRSRFWAVYYMLVCGMLPFQFFRDGFYLVNKQLFFNFLFLPGLILLVMKLMIYLQRPPARGSAMGIQAG